MRTYTQLTQEQRYQIHALLKTKHRLTEIALVTGVHKSIISREVRRKKGLREYRPQQANGVTLARRQSKTCRRIAGETWKVVHQRLKKQGSTEQISS